MRFISDPDTPLLQLSQNDVFTMRDATQGVAVFGGTGSGKTSASGKALASAYLRAGMGGLVLCAKPEEVELWQDYAKANGRSRDIILFGDGGGGGFNFLDYELERQGSAGIGSVIECLMQVLEADKLVKPDASKSDHAFFVNSTRQLLRNSIPILYAATGTVTIDSIYRFVTTAPTDPALLNDATWCAKSYFFAHFAKAGSEPVGPPVSEHEYLVSQTYWEHEFARLDPKTRGNIVISLSTNLDRFMRGRLRDHFCLGTTLTPEMTFDGKIIVMSMPALTWNEDGLIAQHLFKFLWQRAVLARNGLPKEKRARPVMLWADEAQYFVNAFDATYQSTCRSSGGCTVYLTQSVPSYYAAFGGEQAQSRADQFMGNFLTKIFHANADPVTNDWASKTIGRSLMRRGSFSQGESVSLNHGINTGSGESNQSNSSSSTNSWSSGTSQGSSDSRGVNQGRSKGETITQGYSETMDFEVEPAVFGRVLRKGGKQNGKLVDAILYQTGAVFSETGRNYLKVIFHQ